MAITESIGYGGPVGENLIPKWRKAFPGTYGVLGADDWKVTIKTGLDRTVGIASGVGFGGGIRDTNVGEVLVGSLPTLAAGSTRWDLIRANRNTSGTGGVTTFGYTAGVVGSQYATFTSRKRFEVDATQDDQPIALVRVTGGSGGGVIDQVIDLRVWVTDGGAYAENEMVQQYLTDVGTSLWIGTTLWHCGKSPISGAAAWYKSPLLNPVNMLGVGASITPGSIPPAGSAFYMQAGVLVQSSDQSGYARVTFPTPFPNGLLHFGTMRGDDQSNPDVSFGVAGGVWGAGNKTDVVYRVWGPPGGNVARVVLTSYLHRINWFAIGY